MHPNPHFRKETEERNLAFVREHSFGTLAINSENGPLISHIPFRLLEDDRTIELHLVRSNPILKAIEQPISAVLAVTGADGYVSPDWYGVEDQVPTWNYVAVHLRGKLHRLPDERLHDVLSGLSALMEERLLPKKPWTADKMTPEAYESMKRQIVPVQFNVETVDATWKLSQNKPDQARLSAADEMEKTGFGNEVHTLVALMRSVVQAD